MPSILSFPRFRLYVGGALFVAALDIVFKILAHTTFPPTIGSGVRFGLIFFKNPGIAFGLPLPHSIVLPLTLVILGGLGYVIWKHAQTSPSAACAALIIVIGALGNFIDRLVHGYTTDFLLLPNGSVINFSDLLIVFGVFLLIASRPSYDTPDRR